MTLTAALFRMARLSADLTALFSGSPRRMGNRAKNKVLGRLLGRAGFWRALWRWPNG